MRPEPVKIGDASYGLSAILNTWIKMIQSGRIANPIDTLIVNVFTLCRNIYSDTEIRESKSISDFSAQLTTDIQMLLTYYKELFRKNHTADPYVVLYIPSYHTFPQFHLRKESPSAAQLFAQFKKVVQDVCPENQETLMYNDMQCFIVPCGKRMLPHLELETFITRQNAIRKIKYSRVYGLISHYAVDYHLLQRLRGNGFIINSFTGEYVPLINLGAKVFGDKHIPFNSITHLMLGDKTLVKGQLNRRDKKQVLQMAQTNNWRIRTKQQILKDVSGILPEQFLTKVVL